MTDKQIIIDGTDCGYYNEGICWNEDVAIKYCAECNYCYHKTVQTLKAQLEAKEQECEELKLQLAHSCHDVLYKNSLAGQLDQLKVENERLEYLLYDRALQTLEDIEIIAQQGIDFFNETERHADWEKVAIFMKQQLSFILGEIEEG